MTCATCDQSLPPDRHFCPTCGTPAGGPPVEPGARTRGVHGVGVAAIVAVIAVLVGDLAYVVSSLVGGAMAEEAARTGDVELLNRAAVLDGLLSVGYLAVFITAGVLVIVWMWRARKNLEAFPGARQGMGAGWAIAGWLIPFVNLVVPVRVMAAVARASLWRHKTPVTVGVWWAAYLLGGAVAGAGAAAAPALPTVLDTAADYQRYVDYYQSALGWGLAELALSVVAGVLLIRLILSIGRAQEARIARGRTGPLMPGATVPQPPPPGR